MLKPSAKLPVLELSRLFWQQRVERYEAERDAWTASPKQRELEAIEADLTRAYEHLTRQRNAP